MKYLIIGNSAAAIGAVEGIRSRDADGEITIVAGENYHTYSRPLISYLMAGKIDRNKMYYRPRDFYRRHQVQFYAGEKAVQIMPREKSVHIAPSNLNLDYDLLLITAGGTPVLPSSFEGHYDNLLYFHSWDDMTELSARLRSDQPSRIVVVGGGLIGLKAAESLLLRKQQVTVIEAGSYLLNSVMDADGAEIIADYLTARGIKIMVNNPVVQVEGDTAINHLILQDGRRIYCDMVILAAGVKPNLNWLAGSGLVSENGILVNQSLQSSLPDIYAAGDIAQVYDESEQEYRLMPILPEAYRQGRTAGLNMAGGSFFHQGQLFNSIPLLGLNIASAGTNSFTDTGLEIIQKRNGQYNYRRLTLQNQVLKGFIMIGDLNRCGILQGLIQQQTDVSGIKNRLLENDFGLLDIQKLENNDQERGRSFCQ
ncbi:MAG TPA: NAD(P)/FAD-dependent oxidoreductase [Syntrophomonas sp.]|jgi:NAD(P)H-nitrite reductase large subunit|nr:NAD(P)/FAD-dependent oxidoreductase [Syntrophomonas sp.]